MRHLPRRPQIPLSLLDRADVTFGALDRVKEHVVRDNESVKEFAGKFDVMSFMVSKSCCVMQLGNR